MLDLLYAALDARLILVVAGAGYGKTGALTQFARTSGFSFSWLTLDEGEQDLRAFAESLVLSLQRCFPDYGQQLRQLLSSSTAIEQNIPLLAHTFARELSSRLTQPLCIVLDDFHLVESSPAVVEFLDRLIDRLPEDAHLIIASRTLPPLQLGLLIAQQQVTALGQSMLRLDLDETRQLLASLNDLPDGEIAEEITGRAYTATEGWLVGLLMSNQIDRLRQAQVGLVPPRAMDLLGDYLMVQVLQDLPADLQEFLFRSSVLDQISLPFCVKELGWTDIADWVAEVERRNLFIQSMSDVPGLDTPGGATAGEATLTYRYHPLFRDFLQQRLRQDDPIRHAQLQHQVGLAHERAGNIELAMRHFLLGGWSDDVVRLTEAHALSFLQRGRHQTVLDWLARLDTLAPQARAERHLLWQFEVMACLTLNRNAAAMVAIEHLDELYVRGGDMARHDMLNVRRAFVLWRNGEFQKALACANVVIQSVYQQPAWVQAEAHRIGALCHFILGYLTDAHELITRAEQIVQNMGPGGYEPLIHVKLTRAFILDGKGDTAGAVRALSEALALAEEVQNDVLTAEALIKIAEALLFSGEREGLLETVKRGIDLAEATGHLTMRAYGFGVMAAILLAHDRLQDALQASMTGLTLARQIMQAGDRFLTLSSLLINVAHIQCRCAQAEPAADQRAALLMQALTESREAVNIAETGHSAALRLRAYSLLAAVQLLQGDADLAQTALAQAEAARGQFHDNAAGRLSVWQLMAAWQQPQPEVEQVRAYLEQVNQEIALRRQTYMVQAEGESVWQTYQKLRDATDLSALVAHAAPEPPALLSISHPTAPVAVAPHMALVQHDFRIFGFGVGRVLHGDEPIAPSQWGWNIPRELFFYILTMQQATRTQIANIFWPDASTQSMQNSFHSAKFAIRQALGKSAMKYVNGQYTVHDELDYLYDVSSFKQLVASAERASYEEALPKLIEAAEFYTDDFLVDATSDWAVSMRNSLHLKFQQCCHLAGTAALALHQPDAAVPLVERAFGRDNLDEDLARLLMLLQWRCGRRRAALEAYETLKKFLQREMGICPDPETERLAQAIRTAHS